MMNVTQANVAGTDVVQAGDGPDLLLLHSLLADRSVFDRALPDLASDSACACRLTETSTLSKASVTSMLRTRPTAMPR